jgi:TM2 domain-containing membrane protein YozV
VVFFVSDFTQSLSVFVPGATQMVRGQVTLGLFFLSALVFLGALASAVLDTIDRLAPTLDLLGWSAALAFWVLGSAFVLAAAAHLAAVWNGCEAVTEGDRPPRHPVVPAVASLIVPGWGQILNGNRLRAMLFLGGCWLVAGTWVVCSPSTTELLSTYLPVVGPWEQLARAPLLTWSLKWTVPVVLWSLAVYDAAAGAAVHRRSG